MPARILTESRDSSRSECRNDRRKIRAVWQQAARREEARQRAIQMAGQRARDLVVVFTGDLRMCPGPAIREVGQFAFGAIASMMTITRGWFPGGMWKQVPDSEHAMSLDGASAKYPKPDGEYTFDKLSSVFLSGNATRDDAPNHVRIQTHVPREVAQTWVSMCPAQVYEIPEGQLESNSPTVDVHVTASNCVQCGAITAKGGRLTLPEGGDGPLYQET